MKKIITIIGARPQFIKTPLVSKEIRKFAKEILVHTGQHYDANMSAVFFNELKIPKADYNLNVGSGNQGQQTGEMLEKIEQVLLKEKPDLVIIYGDTNSTVSGALAAVKLHIPVAHIESGMRSYNRQMPEEINRIISDHISELLFCSTMSSAKILKEEGIAKGVYFVGDVMADIQKKIRNPKSEIRNKLFKTLNIKPKEYILATVHRQENTDIKENLENIFKAMGQIGETIILPLHPRTKKAIKTHKLQTLVDKNSNLRLIEPIGYLEMLALGSSAKMILTDSGGVQKEAYLNKVPCITLRKETEWIETIQSGWNQLANTNVNKIVRLVKNFPKPKNHPNFLGNGKAYLEIAQKIKEFLIRTKI
ncbi:MAG: UDP-N-acetylglucosamine 2-epimerase [Berkelbacteria bacterium GW2011_GWA1_36_9]|uniref:UDP-N-acetylglucosamine 2-epimerase n=1 Tax=Berkelbacteria bacterium GW2011_GWA1_36_9 TaxID=1618331 RepID=A0A0G0IRW1_9BACT|nr:MAG: UDP-N-acetylglucosamine 2-epimerase [Berkelbacteria bacterium GW2011_GWA1_36_9]